MSADRELLEAAAKAAGMAGTCAQYGDRLAFLEDGKPASLEWNPLTDDGDALRLAVKLLMRVDTDDTNDDGHYGTRVLVFFAERVVDAFVEHEADPYSATRRAIVRAAAAIGGAA